MPPPEAPAATTVEALEPELEVDDVSREPAVAVSSSSERRDTDLAARRWNSRLLLSVLVLTLVIASLPVRNVQYCLPWVVAGHIAFAGRPTLFRRLVASTAALVAGSFLLAIAALGEPNVSGTLWGAATFGTLLFWIAWPRAEFGAVDVDLIRTKGCDAVSIFVVGQSLLGLTQFILSTQPDRPDSVAGTLDPLHFRTGGSSLSQPSLAVMMIGAILFLAALRRTRLHDWATALGACCLLVSQSGHQIMILAGAGLLVAVALDTRPQMLARAALALVGLILAALVLTPATIERIPIWYEQAVASENSLKRQVWVDSIDVITTESAPGFGVGAGQFSSRAGLISSGDYLSVALPEPLSGKSDLFAERVDELVETFDAVGQGSAISKPYSSATSILVEFGPVATLALLIACLSAVVRALRIGRLVDGLERRVNAGLATGILFVLGLSLVENYVELPQALFLPGILYFIAKPVGALDAGLSGCN